MLDASESAVAQPAREEQDLEVRWISPTSLRFLFRQYRLFCRGRSEIASLGTFWSAYRRSWVAVIRVRKSNQHAKCDTCEQLKAAVRHAKLRSDAKAFQTDYDQHQREQFADRRVYYSIRNGSENFFTRPALTFPTTLRATVVFHIIFTLCVRAL